MRTVNTHKESIDITMDKDYERNSLPPSRWAVLKLDIGDDGEMHKHAELRTHTNCTIEDDYILEGGLSPRELYMGLDTRLCWATRCWEMKLAREAALLASHAAPVSAPGQCPSTGPAHVELRSDYFCGGAGDVIANEISPKNHFPRLDRLKKFWGLMKAQNQDLPSNYDTADGLGTFLPQQTATDLKQNMAGTPDFSENGHKLDENEPGTPKNKPRKSLLKRICRRLISAGRHKYRYQSF